MTLARRLIQLFVGLLFYGLSIALIVRGDLGLDPWNVLTQGLFERWGQEMGISFGTIVNLVGVVVLLLWIPLRQRPGFGTVANVALIGPAANLFLALIPADMPIGMRVAFLVSGVVLTGLASSAYIGAGLGAGPRDGLMTGIVARTGWPVKWVRTGIELVVVCVGWILGGSVGLGTVLFALTIGPLVHVFLPMFTIGEQANRRKP